MFWSQLCLFGVQCLSSNSYLVPDLWSWLLGTSISCVGITLYPRAQRMISLLLALAKLIYCLQHNLTQLKKRKRKRKPPECKEKQHQALLSSVSILPWVEMTPLKAPELIYLLWTAWEGEWSWALQSTLSFLYPQHPNWLSLHNLKTTHSVKWRQRNELLWNDCHKRRDQLWEKAHLM